MKTTHWFEAGKENPVRVGVYQVSLCDGSRYKHWNGILWGWCARTPDDAEIDQASKYAKQESFQWRGILKESE